MLSTDRIIAHVVVIPAMQLLAIALSLLKILLGWYMLSLIWATIYHFRGKRFPGPFAWPMLGNVPQLLLHGSNSEDFFKAVERYGPVVEMWLPKFALFVNSAPVAWQVLDEKSSNFIRRPISDEALVFLGLDHGIIANNDLHSWKRGRALIIKGLQQKFLAQTPSVICDKYAMMKRYLPSITRTDGSIDIWDVCRRIIADVVGTIALETDFNCCSGETPEFIALSESFSELIMVCLYQPSFLWKYFPSARVRYLKAQDRKRKDYIARMADSICARYRNKAQDVTTDTPNTSNGVSFADLVSRASLEEGDRSVSKEELIQITNELIFAGTDTSTVALTYTILLLAEHKDVQHLLREEILHASGGEQFPTLRILSNMPLADKIIQEAMRHQAVIPYINRENVEGAEVAGVSIPPHTMVIVKSHPQPERYLSVPSAFDPANIDSAAAFHRGANMPFGGGVRICPGRHFAMIELKCILWRLLRDFEISQHNGLSLKNLKVHSLVFVVPAQPVLVRLHKL